MNFFFFQSEAQTKTQGIKSVFCLDFQLIFSALNIWQIKGQIYLLVLKALVFIKSEFDSTFPHFPKNFSSQLYKSQIIKANVDFNLYKTYGNFVI